jgi:hypothetical protein
MERMGTITSPFSQIQAWAMGGAVSRVAADATAVGEREVGFDISFITGWPPPDPEGAPHKAWVREGWDALRSHSVGVYANFISDEGAAGVQAAYGGGLARLTALKDRWDPANVFRNNANIPPSEGRCPMTVLVTEATGDIGSRVVHRSRKSSGPSRRGPATDRSIDRR